MDEIKFVDDADVKSLFSSNETESETGVEQIAPEDLKSMFSGEDDDPAKTDDPENTEAKATENASQINYSEVAKQLGFDDEVSDLESLKNLIENKISSGIDEDTRRVKEALEYGVDSKDINEFEETIKYLHSITKDVLIQESEESDNIRKRLILQDLYNKGVEEKEAVQEVKRIFKEGKDIEEAEKALENNKKYFSTEYKKLIEEAKKNADEYKNGIDKQTAEIRDSIMNNGFMGIDVDEITKKKAMKNISEPVYKDPETGENLTAIQKYQRENPTDFLKNLSMIFTLTDGFKSLDKIVDPIVKKKMNKQIGDVEDVLKNPSSNEGNLKMVTNESTSSNSRFKFAI